LSLGCSKPDLGNNTLPPQSVGILDHFVLRKHIFFVAGLANKLASACNFENGETWNSCGLMYFN